MAAPLSIILPTLNAEQTIGPTLASLATGLTSGLIREVILSEGGRSAEMAAIAEEAGAVLVEGPAGRGGQLRRGAEAAKGEWLMFLHADSVLASGWDSAISAHMQRNNGNAGWFDLRFDTDGFAPRCVAGWANARSRYLGLPYGDQGLLIPRSLYERAGGFRDIPLMEDVAMARALRGRLVSIGHILTTSAARYEAEGWLRRGGRNLWLLLLYFLGHPPEKLAAKYTRKGRKL